MEQSYFKVVSVLFLFESQARNLSTSVQVNLPQLVQPTLDYLLSLQFRSGNFPSSLESDGRDKLVQWCHGAPGFVHVLSLAHQVGSAAIAMPPRHVIPFLVCPCLPQLLGGESYLTAAERCGQVVWSRGLLKKGYGLCHGVAGNGFTFLQLYRLTGEPHHLHRAIKVWITFDRYPCLVHIFSLKNDASVPA